MVAETDEHHATNFTISIEAAEGITTGISAHDRAKTIQAAVAPGAKPEHLVRMRIFVTDVAAYKALGKEIGKAYRKHFGTWFPAMSLFEISCLYDEGALIEVESEAVVP